MALKRLIRSPDQAHTMDTLLHLASSSAQLPQLRRPSPSACWPLWPCGRGLRLPRSGAATPPAAVCTSAVRCFSSTNKLTWGSLSRFCSPWCSSGVFRWPADCAPTSTSAANPILHFSWIPDITSATNPTLRNLYNPNYLEAGDATDQVHGLILCCSRSRAFSREQLPWDAALNRDNWNIDGGEEAVRVALFGHPIMRRNWT
jgi:hypothetical protein